MSEVGRKNDHAKIRLSLVPWSAMQIVVRVLEHGAREYGADNWRHVPDGPRRYGDAAGRHLVAWWSGETLDPDSGKHHLAHAVASLLFVIALELEQLDERIELAQMALAGAEAFDDEELERRARAILADLTKVRDSLGVRR